MGRLEVAGVGRLGDFDTGPLSPSPSPFEVGFFEDAKPPTAGLCVGSHVGLFCGAEVGRLEGVDVVRLGDFDTGLLSPPP